MSDLLEGELRRLVGDLWPVIHKRVARVLSRRGLAQDGDIRQEVIDVTQNVCVALLKDNCRRLRAYDPARGMSLENFVGRIAQQMASHAARSRQEQSRREVTGDDLEATLDSRTPEGIVGSKRQLIAIANSVRSRVSPQGYQVFELLFLEERDVPDVCRMLGMSRDAVYAWRSRLRRLIKELIEQIENEDTTPSSPC